MKIYYVGLDLSDSWCCAVSQLLKLSQPKRFHATIIYSRTWFPYKPWRFEKLFTKPTGIEIFNGLKVLRFEDVQIAARHQQFREAGATWDYLDYKGHITIGPAETTPDIFPPIITFESEYYQTWEEVVD